MNKAVFLDKDGTIIDDFPYNVKAELIVWKDGIFEALQQLLKEGYLLVIITNQSGVAKGHFAEEDLHILEASMNSTFKEHGIVFSGFYYSPFHTQAVIEKYKVDSECRKPAPGMILRAAEDLQIDLSASWMVGDMLTDVEAGINAGCKTILLSGSGQVPLIKEHNQPTFVVDTIQEAVAHIIA